MVQSQFASIAIREAQAHATMILYPSGEGLIDNLVHDSVLERVLVQDPDGERRRKMIPPSLSYPSQPPIHRIPRTEVYPMRTRKLTHHHLLKEERSLDYRIRTRINQGISGSCQLLQTRVTRVIMASQTQLRNSAQLLPCSYHRPCPLSTSTFRFSTDVRETSPQVYLLYRHLVPPSPTSQLKFLSTTTPRLRRNRPFTPRIRPMTLFILPSLIPSRRRTSEFTLYQIATHMHHKLTVRRPAVDLGASSRELSTISRTRTRLSPSKTIVRRHT